MWIKMKKRAFPVGRVYCIGGIDDYEVNPAVLVAGQIDLEMKQSDLRFLRRTSIANESAYDALLPR